MTETPIIGVLSQEAYIVRKAYPEAHSFIAASYVKILESSGARVVPIWIGQDNAYYERVIQYTNGVLFPGGGTYFNETGGYGEAAKQLYKLAIKANDEGVHYPLWGICLGLQVLAFAALNGEDVRGDCSCKNVALPLEFVQGYNQSKLFSDAPEELMESVKLKNITFNYHQFCLFEDVLKEKGLLNDWRIISVNKDTNGLEFVSTMENFKYPFYGMQFHPEKSPFEFEKGSFPHSFEAIQLAQYLGNFFVQESRRNNHSFSTEGIEKDSLIYNYSPVYSARNTTYEQLYLFKPEDYNRTLLI